MCFSKHQNGGFSLIEVLLAISLIAVLLTLATPVYKSFLSADRSRAEMIQLTSAINFARSEAARRHAMVTLCKSADGKTCAGDWSQGWIVFVDKNGSGHIENAAELLMVHQILKTQDQLHWDASRSDDYLQLDPSGNTHGQDGTFVYCPSDKNSQSAYAVMVSQTGRTRLSKGKDANGQPLNCG